MRIKSRGIEYAFIDAVRIPNHSPRINTTLSQFVGKYLKDIVTTSDERFSMISSARSASRP